MPQALGVRGLGVGDGASGLDYGYSTKVQTYSPYAYWPLWETEGAVAHCLIDPNQDGAYVGVTLGHSEGPDGNPVPLFDGTNDYVNILTATLNTNFDGAVGSMAAWFKVYNASVWTEIVRYVMRLFADTSNNIYMRKDSTEDQVSWRYKSGGAALSQVAACGLLSWVHMAMTWDRTTENKVHYYLSGTEVLPASSGLLAWTGALTIATIGSMDLVPAQVWYGWLAHAALWDTVLTPANVADLAVIP